MDKDYEQTLELARRFDSFMKESEAIAKTLVELDNNATLNLQLAKSVRENACLHEKWRKSVLNKV